MHYKTLTFMFFLDFMVKKILSRLLLLTQLSTLTINRVHSVL